MEKSKEKNEKSQIQIQQKKHSEEKSIVSFRQLHFDRLFADIVLVRRYLKVNSSITRHDS